VEVKAGGRVSSPDKTDPPSLKVVTLRNRDGDGNKNVDNKKRFKLAKQLIARAVDIFLLRCCS